MSFYRGRLYGIIELGTIVGPSAFGELLVARDYDTEGYTRFYTATEEDIEAAKTRDPQSLTEFKWRKYDTR